jgi:glycine/D-amino acid oxidase-like deaminating enzyme
MPARGLPPLRPGNGSPMTEPSAPGEAVRADRVSYWIASSEAPHRRPLAADTEADVVVVGAGIVGLTAAFLLAEAGRDVLVLEGDVVAGGVSGYTTAKLTAGHRVIYSRLKRAFDGDTARAYAQAQSAAIEFVRVTCAERGIECDLEARPNIVYAESPDDRRTLEQEAEAARRAGLPVELVDDLPIPVATTGALRLAEQAQFHPRKYLVGLAALVEQAGARVCERSRVTEVAQEGPGYRMRTDDAAARASTVVVATHYPIVEQGFFATRIHPQRSYVVAAPLRGPDVAGMYINVSLPTRSVRTTPLPNGGRLLIVSGEGHRVGQEDNTAARDGALERFLHETFEVGETLYRWSTQDNYSVDGLPFVGEVEGSPGLYVATGFAAWGMSNGTMAGMTLADAVGRRRSPWADTFALARRPLRASAARFLRENANVAAQLLRRSDAGGVADVEPDGGAVVSVDGRKVAVSRGPEGDLRAVSAACTHMGCTVSWNGAEGTWDCPCHGSRFAPDGSVLHGPALRPLEPVELGAPAAQTG